MSTQHPLTRRRFLGGAAALAFPTVVPSSALGGSGRPAPSERIPIGFIGLGGQGVNRNLRGFLQQPDAEPVALCDCDLRQLPRAVKVAKGKGFDCETTQDWRKVVDRDDVDAVMISTPDHWHVPISLAAIRAGKDVICEKPTLTVEEGRVLADTVGRYDAVFQTATEDRSVGVYHRLAELVRNERIGKLRAIRVTLPYVHKSGDATPRPVPDGFDYDMWLGPAPWAPYTPDRCHFDFRFISDYSGGILTDWGMHLLDTAQWANGTERTGPVEVQGSGVYHEGPLYDTAYEFDLTYTYASGVKLHVASGGTGIRFEGTDGWVESPSWRAPLQASDPAILHSTIRPNETHLFTCPAGEHRNFLDCVKSREDPYFPAEVGHRCATIQHIGNIAMKLRRRLRWDPTAERFEGEPTANRMLGRAMREPWRL